MNIFQFMSDSPWLTFFLACTLGSTLVGVVRGIRGLKEKDEDEDSEEKTN